MVFVAIALRLPRFSRRIRATLAPFGVVCLLVPCVFSLIAFVQLCQSKPPTKKGDKKS